MSSFSAALAGLGLGFSLIVAIGAQNLFVLRQGMRREHVAAIIVICAGSDAALIAVGVSGLGAAVQQVPWLVEVVRWIGAAFLVTYGVLAARRALKPTHEVLDTTDGPPAGAAPTAAPGGIRTATTTTTTATTLRAAVLTCLALTWLNPHVYLDTVFLLGGIASTHGDDRWAFGAGAVVASIVWFTALGVGARFLGVLLRSPRAWRILDGIIAVVMIAIGVMLVLPS